MCWQGCIIHNPDFLLLPFQEKKVKVPTFSPPMEEVKATSYPKYLILDVDGTLISEDTDEIDQVVPRPYLLYFLLFCFQSFHGVAIFSAASRYWVFSVIQRHIRPLLPPSFQFLFVWSSERCTRKKLMTGLFDYEYITIKRLAKVTTSFPQCTKHNMLVLDNTRTTFQENFGNGIHIPTFMSTMTSDDYLLQATKYMANHLLHLPTVRFTEKRMWISIQQRDDQMETEKWSVDPVD